MIKQKVIYGRTRSDTVKRAADWVKGESRRCRVLGITLRKHLSHLGNRIAVVTYEDERVTG